MPAARSREPRSGCDEPEVEPSLRIGLVAPPWVPVPPPVYGGTEVVVDQLARGLERAGHTVVLFTTGDSTCPVDRRWFHPRALGTTTDLVAGELAHVEAAYEELHAAGVDIIHDHTLLGCLWSTVACPTIPVVVTNHGAFTPTVATFFEHLATRVGLIAISEQQRSTAPSVRVATVIHHGVDADEFVVGDGRGGYVAFLGRMSPDKGVHLAISIARRAGKKLLIAAKMWEPSEKRYFREVVEPMLGPDAIYLGEVDAAGKAELLAGAEALLNPIRWPEPFGLVMIEALAAGTPVLAFPMGAAPEIVDHGRTGFLCDDDRDMSRRLTELASIDRNDCRAAALSRFSVERMVDDHVRFYRSVLNARSVAVQDRATACPARPVMALRTGDPARRSAVLPIAGALR